MLQNKGNLKSAAADWMQTVYLHPSLPYDERVWRDRLYHISDAQNGLKPAKENRHLMWLNPRTEKYELQKIKDGQWAKTDEIDAPTADETAAAIKAVDDRRATFKKPKVPMDTGQPAAQSKN